jgi:hypothetical protein
MVLLLLLVRAKKGTGAEEEETAEATPTLLFLLSGPKTTSETPELGISITAKIGSRTAGLTLKNL